MFIDSAQLYDAIYSFKNYARECDRLLSLIDALVPGTRNILDVACGTGEHAQFLKQHHAIDGIDINESYLRAARLKNPSGNYIRADVMNFELARKRCSGRWYRPADSASNPISTRKISLAFLP